MYAKGIPGEISVFSSVWYMSTDVPCDQVAVKKFAGADAHAQTCLQLRSDQRAHLDADKTLRADNLSLPVEVRKTVFACRRVLTLRLYYVTDTLKNFRLRRSKSPAFGGAPSACKRRFAAGSGDALSMVSVISTIGAWLT